MNKVVQNIPNHKIYYRIIALWALCEGMLGGIIHGLRLPVSGMFIGTASLICICLIGYFFPGKGNIITATFVVAFFKLMISPHSPPMAYLAVFFQGFLGEFLFKYRKNYKLICLILAMITMLESALQRILVLVILYGFNFWKAVNNFIVDLTHQTSNINYILIISITYIVSHLCIGIIVGWLAGRLPQKLEIWKNKREYFLHLNSGTDTSFLNRTHKKRKRIKIGLYIVWILLIIIYIQSIIPIGKPILAPHLSLQIFIRSVLIVLGWYLLLSPLLMRWLKSWLEKKQSQFKENIQDILQLLPLTKQIVEKSWILSSNKKGLKRIHAFTKIVLVNTFHA